MNQARASIVFGILLVTILLVHRVQSVITRPNLVILVPRLLVSRKKICNSQFQNFTISKFQNFTFSQFHNFIIIFSFFIIISSFSFLLELASCLNSYSFYILFFL